MGSNPIGLLVLFIFLYVLPKTDTALLCILAAQYVTSNIIQSTVMHSAYFCFRRLGDVKTIHDIGKDS